MRVIEMNSSPLRLASLVEGFGGVEEPMASLEVTGLTQDSRTVSSGSLFLAMPGITDGSDGRNYIDDAIARGAGAILFEAMGEDHRTALPVPAIAVTNLRAHAGAIASRYYQEPSARMMVIGVTGTNGKTTSLSLLSQAMTLLDRPCGQIGTLGSGFWGALHGGGLTTPDVVSLHRELAELLEAGAQCACVEVSSHALDQGRVDEVKFRAALFTNISHDHLDYHGSMEAYVKAKKSLFSRVGLEHVVVNLDDRYADEFLAEVDDQVALMTYGSEGDVRVVEAKPFESGLLVRLATPYGEMVFTSPLVGMINLPNLVGVAAMLLSLGYKPNQIEGALAKIEPIPGRMERIGRTANGAQVFVDFAHTPDALQKALNSLRELQSGSIWVVFGCGGNRDLGKRRLMGEVVSTLSDHIVVTSDNPRNEDPDEIIAQIMEGISSHQCVVLPDRGAAIDHAVHSAEEGDLVLVAGKGHESTQIIGSEALFFSDRLWIEQLLEGGA